MVDWLHHLKHSTSLPYVSYGSINSLNFHGRLVLSAVSDYFAAMFTSDVREAKQEEIKMEGVDPEALRSLVHFAYTGECS